MDACVCDTKWAVLLRLMDDGLYGNGTTNLDFFFIMVFLARTTGVFQWAMNGRWNVNCGRAKLSNQKE
jgi:hypothetical protein